MKKKYTGLVILATISLLPIYLHAADIIMDHPIITRSTFSQDFVILIDVNGQIYYTNENSSETFASYRLIWSIEPGRANGVVIDDFDHDQDLDFVIASAQTNQIILFLFINQGENNFLFHGPIGTFPDNNSDWIAIQSTDYNLDSYCDIVVAGNQSQTALFENNDQGQFSVTLLPFPKGKGMDIADANNDGYPDIARVNSSDGLIYIYPGSPNSYINTPEYIGTITQTPIHVTFGDFNNDGWPDLIVNTNEKGAPYFIKNNQDGTFSNMGMIAFLSHDLYGTYGACDLNQDGNTDIIAIDNLWLETWYYPGNGDGTFGRRRIYIGTINDRSYCVAPPPFHSFGKPIASPKVDRNLVPLGGTIQLDASESTDTNDTGHILSYQWIFDDGIIKTGAVVSHTFGTNETVYERIHPIRLQVTDNDGFSDSKTIHVTVTGDMPIAVIQQSYTSSGTPDSGCYTLSFNASQSMDNSQQISYEWNLGDGFQDKFDSDLSTHWMTPYGDWQLSDSQLIQSNAKIDRAYMIAKNIIHQNYTIESTIRLLSNANGYAGFICRYQNDGSGYEIFLRGEPFHDILLQKMIDKKTQQMQTCKLPFLITQNEPYQLTVQLKDNELTIWINQNMAIHTVDTSFPTGGFGLITRNCSSAFDTFKLFNSIKQGMSITHSYPKGLYHVLLTVCDPAKQCNTNTIQIIPGDFPPIAQFESPQTITEAYAKNGVWTVMFDASPSSDDTGIVRYDWDFGDGSTAQGVQVTHAFQPEQMPAQYLVSLIVTDTVNTTNQLSKQITLTPGNAPIIYLGAGILTEGQWPVTLDASNAYDDFGIASIQWDLGDGIQLEGTKVQHIYWEPKTYAVTCTVMDHARQTNTAQISVYSIVGDKPNANAGSLYVAGQSSIPACFDGSRSMDDYGILYYFWDIDDQIDSDNDGDLTNDIDIVGKTACYVYDKVGTFRATLTVIDGAGQKATSSAVVEVKSNMNPAVTCIPFSQNNPNLAHEVYPGRPVHLKAIVQGVGNLTYQWDFGDSCDLYPLTPGPVPDNHVIDTDHIYPNSPNGTIFIATITVWDSSGKPASDEYYIVIKPETPRCRAQLAIEDGLWWLYKNQDKETGAWHGPNGTILDVSSTALAMQAFLQNGYQPFGQSTIHPYNETLTLGLRYLFNQLKTQTIQTQPYGNPDSNNNTLGITSNTPLPVLDSGFILSTLASSIPPIYIAFSGEPTIKHQPVYNIVNDMSDMIAYGQTDSGTYRGAWGNEWNSGYDPNACIAVALGMMASENMINRPNLDFIKNQAFDWLLNDYTSHGLTGEHRDQRLQSIATLLHLILGDHPTAHELWIAAENHIADSWQYIVQDYLALYATAMALKNARPAPIVEFNQTGLNWFNDPYWGAQTRLIENQIFSDSMAGSWHGMGTTGRVIDTAFAILTLSLNVSGEDPIADAGLAIQWAFDRPLAYDASRSFHPDPLKRIVRYEWDFDGNGVWDYSSSDPSNENATYTFSDPHPQTPGDQITLVSKLRITDDNSPPKQVEAMRKIMLTDSGFAPIAVHGGAYYGTINQPVLLNASESFDLDALDHIRIYQWDTDQDDQWFDQVDIDTDNPEVPFIQSYPGTYTIGLRVWDEGVDHPVGCIVGETCIPQVSAPVFTSVMISGNYPPIVNAGEDQIVHDSSNVILDGSLSYDPDGTQLTYAWEQISGLTVTLNNATLSQASFTPPSSITTQQTLVFQLSVKDKQGVEVSDTVTIQVMPFILNAVIVNLPEQVNVDDLIRFQGGFEPDYYQIRAYEWSIVQWKNNNPLGTPIPISQALSFATNAIPKGVWQISLVVTDDKNRQSQPATQILTVNDLWDSDIYLSRDQVNLFCENATPCYDFYEGQDGQIQVTVKNIGMDATSNPIRVSVYDGSSQTDQLTGDAIIQSIAPNHQCTVQIPWKPGFHANGDPLPEHQSGARILIIQANYISDSPISERSIQNNQTTIGYILHPYAGDYETNQLLITLDQSKFGFSSPPAFVSGFITYGLNEKPPALGIPIMIKMDNGDLYTTHSMAPDGRWAIDLNFPMAIGSYNFEIMASCGQWHHSQSQTLHINAIIPSPTDMMINAIDVSGHGVHVTSSGCANAIANEPVYLSAWVSIASAEPISTNCVIAFYAETESSSQPIMIGSEHVWIDNSHQGIQFVVPCTTAFYPAQTGVYRIIAVCDVENSLNETNEINNSMSRLIQVSDLKPDLIPALGQGIDHDGIQLSNATPIPGDIITLFCPIMNSGSAPVTSSFDVVFYLINQHIRQEIGRKTMTGDIQPHETVMSFVSWPTGTYSPGKYKIYAVIDASNTLSEIWEDNNETYGQLIIYPNNEFSLVPEAFVIQMQYQGDVPEFLLSVTIQNMGGAVSENLQVRFYKGNPDTTAPIMDAIQTGMISSGASKQLSVLYQPKDLQSGFHEFCVTVHGHKRFAVYRIPAQSHAIIQTQSIHYFPEPCDIGDSMRVSVSIENQGMIPLLESYQLAFYKQMQPNYYQLLHQTPFTNIQPFDSRLVTVDPLFTIQAPISNLIIQSVMNSTSMDVNSVYISIPTISLPGPQARGGGDRIGIIGSSITLDASQSLHATHYFWQMIKKPIESQASLVYNESVQTSFVPDHTGEYLIRLKAFNAYYLDEDIVRIIVSDANYITGTVLTSLSGQASPYSGAIIHVKETGETVLSNHLGEYTLNLPINVTYTIDITTRFSLNVSYRVTVTSQTNQMDAIELSSSLCPDLYTEEQMKRALLKAIQPYDPKNDLKIGLDEALLALRLASESEARNAFKTIETQYEARNRFKSIETHLMCDFDTVSLRRNNAQFTSVTQSYKSGVYDQYNRQNREKSNPYTGLTSYIRGIGKISTDNFDDNRENRTFIHSFSGLSIGETICCAELNVWLMPLGNATSISEKICLFVCDASGNLVSNKWCGSLSDFSGNDQITLQILRTDNAFQDILNQMFLHGHLDISVGENTSVDYMTLKVIYIVPSATVTGRIATQLTGSMTFVSNATVYLDPIGKVQTTNALGEYTFQSIPFGTYTLRAESPFLAEEINDAIVINHLLTELEPFLLTQLRCDGIYTQEDINQAIIEVLSRYDNNLDHKIGLIEVIHALQAIVGN